MCIYVPTERYMNVLLLNVILFKNMTQSEIPNAFVFLLGSVYILHFPKHTLLL